MRLFFAIDVPNKIRECAFEFLQRLQVDVAGVKWVERENLHLTLRFLGEVATDKLADISNVAADTAACHEPFTMSLRGVSAFPSPTRARVIVISADRGETEAREIFTDLNQELHRVGMASEERPFVAHLTIGRIKGALPQGIEILKKENDRLFGEFIVDRFVLVESRLSREGPEYTRIGEFRLGSVLQGLSE